MRSAIWQAAELLHGHMRGYECVQGVGVSEDHILVYVDSSDPSKLRYKITEWEDFPVKFIETGNVKPA